jgi:hypothetical protein
MTLNGGIDPMAFEEIRSLGPWSLAERWRVTGIGGGDAGEPVPVVREVEARRGEREASGIGWIRDHEGAGSGVEEAE